MLEPFLYGGGTGGGVVGWQWGQLPLQNIRRGGYTSTIAHSHDRDTASPIYYIPYTHKLMPLQLDSVAIVQAN